MRHSSARGRTHDEQRFSLLADIDPGNKRFSAAWDGRLQALDLRSGKLLWSTRTFDLGQPLYITGGPKAFKNKVIIGNSGTATCAEAFAKALSETCIDRTIGGFGPGRVLAHMGRPTTQ